MVYAKKAWSNGASGGTPVNAAELNRMEDGIDAALNNPTWLNIQGIPIILASLWNGSGYPNNGNSVTDYRGPSEPTLANNGGRPFTGYDQWLRAAASDTAAATQTNTTLGAQGPITLGTYNFNLPSNGITVGDTVIFAFALATSVAGDATHNITFTVADGTNAATRTITPVAAAQTATGFSSHIYSFNALAGTPGAAVTITRAGTNTATGSVRCIPHVMSITGLASSIPTLASKSGVISGATKTSPTGTAPVANSIEVSFVGDRDTTSPYTTSWSMTGTTVTQLSATAYTATSPAHSSAIGWNPQPVAAGATVGGRTWTAVGNGGVENSDSFGGAWTLTYTANPSSTGVNAARFAWNPSLAAWTQI